MVLSLAMPGAAAGELDFYILATADIHGRVDIIRGPAAAKMRDFKQRYPRRVLWVDTGDTAQGSWQINRRRGQGMLSLLAEQGCTLWVPGNHELEYGFEAFKKIVREFPYPVLAANLRVPELQDKLSAWQIVDMQGVKIAFVGMTVGSFAQTFPVPENRLQMLPEAASLRRAAMQARAAGADIIVLLRHAGVYGGGVNLAKLLKKVPEIDLVIGGHSHFSEPGCRVGHSWFVQPPAHGKGMAVIRLQYDRNKRRLIMIGSSIAEFEQRVVNEPIESSVAVPVAVELPEDFPVRKMRDFLRSDLAVYLVDKPEKFNSLLQHKAPTAEDYFEVFNYFDAVITVVVTPGELVEIMQEYTRLALKRKQRLLTAGFRCNTTRRSLKSIVFEENKESYLLALTAFAAAGAAGQLPGIRRLLRDRIDHAAAENACGIMDILLTQ